MLCCEQLGLCTEMSPFSWLLTATPFLLLHPGSETNKRPFFSRESSRAACHAVGGGEGVMVLANVVTLYFTVVSAQAGDRRRIYSFCVHIPVLPSSFYFVLLARLLPSDTASLRKEH